MASNPVPGDRKKIDDNGNEQLKKKIGHLQKALDDLVSVNSLFTFAMFVGISFASADPKSLESRKECQADYQTKMTLLFDEVVSFVCFLLSSLVATALKMHLSTYLTPESKHSGGQVMNGVRSSIIMVSVAGSILGCVYLTLSMFNVVRVLLGNITCGESDTVLAAGSLIAINVLALLVYVPSLVNAVFLSYSRLQFTTPQQGHS